MDPWIWWMLIAVACGVIEVMTLDLVFAMFGGAAVIASITSVFTNGWAIPTIVFGATAVAALGVVRPVALRHLRQGPELKSGVAALVGKAAVVIERVDAESGLVKLAGEVWSARSYDGMAVLEQGSAVTVVEIRGATAYVL